MPTQLRKPTLTELAQQRQSNRAKGEQLIPLSDDYLGVSRRRRDAFFNRQSYDGSQQSGNQLKLYDSFKLATLGDKVDSELQDIIAKNGTVSAAMDAYVSTASTQISIEPGPDDNVNLWDAMLKMSPFKQRQDQVFEMLFRRGGAVVEFIFDRVQQVWLPIEMRVHDPKRFDFEEQDDPRVKGGEQYSLGLSNRDLFDKRFEKLNNPAIKYIAWRPKAGEKPFGRSRISAATYYAASLVQTIRLVTKILSKSGSPVLPITIDKQKLFGGPQNATQLYSGDMDTYIRQQAADLRKTIPKLGEGDALILTGEMVLGEYLTPGSRLNMAFLDEWQNALRLDILQSMNVPPAVIGIVQKSSALNDHNTMALIRDFKNNCKNDQELVGDSLEPIIAYGLQINNIRKRKPVSVMFAFSNPEETDLMLDVKQKRAMTIKETVTWITEAKNAGLIDDMEAKELYDMEMQALEVYL